MCIIHKWKSDGFVRSCTKCHRHEALCWFCLIIPKFKRWPVMGIMGWPWDHEIIAIELISFRLFRRWKAVR